MTGTIIEKFCIRDVWLEAMTGRSAFNIKPGNHLHNESFADEIKQMQKRAVFLSAKVPVTEIAMAKKLQELGLYIVDTNVVFEKSDGFNKSKAVIKGLRPAQLKDESGVVEVARRSFKFTRFHLDPEIPNETADSIKAEWARNFFKGKRGDELIVVDQGGIKGFCLLFVKPDCIVIDLIAVDQNAANKGFGTAMLQYIEGHYKGIGNITAGTQMANVPSQRLYEKNGYRLKEASYVFHYFN